MTGVDSPGRLGVFVRTGHEVWDVCCAAADTTSDDVHSFCESLTEEETMLVVLKRELYAGSWDEMTADLKARLEGGPYIFKLANRITDDLARIDRLRSFERKRDVDLSDFVKLRQ